MNEHECAIATRVTLGRAIPYDGLVVQVCSKTHGTISLSSAEAELYDGRNCSAAVMSCVAWSFCVLGIDVQALTDASAALGVVDRHGLGQTKQTSTGPLWVQRKHLRKDILYVKVDWLSNVADVLTTCGPLGVIEKQLGGLGCESAFWLAKVVGCALNSTGTLASDRYVCWTAVLDNSLCAMV